MDHHHQWIFMNLNKWTDVLPLSHRPLWLSSSIAIYFIVYFINFNGLDKLVRTCIVHKNVPTINKHRLVNAIWRVIFCIFTIMLFTVNPWVSRKVNNSIFEVLFTSAVPICNGTLLHGSKNNHEFLHEDFLLITPIVFFLHQSYILYSFKMKPPVVSYGFCIVFLSFAYHIKCASLCILVLFLLAVNMGSLELAKVFYALKSRCRGFEGPPVSLSFQLIATSLFVVHLVGWAVVTLYQLPLLFLSLPSVTEVDPASRLAMAYINIFIVSLFLHQFFNLPFWSLVELMVKRQSGIRKLHLLSLPAVVLLPYTSSLLPELRTLQKNFRASAFPTSAEIRMRRKKILSSSSQSNIPPTPTPATGSQGNSSASPTMESKDLLSIIKCIRIFKRKMRHRYEQNKLNEASDNDEAQGLNNERAREKLTPSCEPEVTDIFFPVPSTSHTKAGQGTWDHEIPGCSALSVDQVDDPPNTNPLTKKKNEEDHQLSASQNIEENSVEETSRNQENDDKS